GRHVAQPALDLISHVDVILSSAFSGFLLQQAFGLLQRALPLGRQVLAGTVDEELDHADARADALGADLLAGHDAGDGLGVLGEQALWRVGRDSLHPPDPLLLSHHDSLRRITAYLTQTVLTLTNSRMPNADSSRP